MVSVKNRKNELSGTSKSIEAQKCLDFGDFHPVSVKNRKRAQRHTRPVEAQNKKTLVVCLPSSRRELRLW